MITSIKNNSVYFLFLVLLITSCARNPVTGKREVMLMSQNQELQLGASSDPQIVAQYGLYESAAIQSFIDDKGQEMAAISHRPDLDYSFKVLDSPVVNAFAVPGGYVYFTRGILAHFNNEAEFAGVLGHEIGHVTARHSAKQYSKQMLGQVAFLGGVIFSEKFRTFANEANTGMQLLFLKFGRSAESQSDELGVEYSTKIGYDSHNMANFFGTLKRLQGESGQSIPSFLSTHPDPGNRFNDVHQLSDEIQQEYPKESLKTNRDSYLRMIDGMIVGVDPKQGYVEDGKFYHPELLFEFLVPANWQINNTPSAVQMVPQDGNALLTMVLAAGTSLNDASNQVITENNLTVIERGNQRINGFEAIEMISNQVTPAQQQGAEATTIRIYTALIKYGDLIYVFHGMSSPEDFTRMYPTFQATARSFAKLLDPEKINKQPDVLKIVTIPSQMTHAQAMTRFGMTSEQSQELEILNGMESTTVLEAGSLLKTLVKRNVGS